MQVFAGELTVKLYSRCHSVTSIMITDSEFQGRPSPNGKSGFSSPDWPDSDGDHHRYGVCFAHIDQNGALPQMWRGPTVRVLCLGRGSPAEFTCTYYIYFLCAALVKSTMESLQHIDHFGVHLKVCSRNHAAAQELIQFSFYYLPVYSIYMMNKTESFLSISVRC